MFNRSFYIASYCKKNKIDTVISFRESCNFSSILSKLFLNNSKIIVGVRNNIESSKNWLYKLFIKLLYPISDLIVPITKAESLELQNKYWIPSKKIKYIYNMIDVEDAKKNLYLIYEITKIYLIKVFSHLLMYEGWISKKIKRYFYMHLIYCSKNIKVYS